MFNAALPILGVSSSDAAEAFYCGQLGFEVKYTYRPDPQRRDPCWMGVQRGGAHIVLSSFEADGPPGTRGVQIYVQDAAGLLAEWRASGVPDLPESPMDQTWGNAEFNLRDPDGNLLNMASDRSSPHFPWSGPGPVG